MTPTISRAELLDLWDRCASPDPRERVLEFYERLHRIQRTLESLDVPSGTINRLRRAGVRTLADLQGLNRPDLLSLKGIGPMRAAGIQQALERMP
jgi:DNA-directed RNA polymerase alpha subunit